MIFPPSEVVMMDIEPEIRKEKRRIREQRYSKDAEHEEIEGMTERPHKTHELESSPLKVFSAIVAICLVATLVVGAVYMYFF
ncbi:hypothetical protein ACLVWU_04585 [Bdellovibrio sp. HCB290]|uniref:hypothetical protein n=1 Tax=Bdellovibrio sp. HCB290 TaxID=3394356 RepID=UPI0039B5E671